RMRLSRSTLFPYTTLFRSDRVLEPDLFTEAPSNLKTVHLRHADVEQDDLGPVGGGDLKRRSSVVRRRDIVTEVAHELRERLGGRSEEHTSELQSRFELVCR